MIIAAQASTDRGPGNTKGNELREETPGPARQAIGPQGGRGSAGGSILEGQDFGVRGVPAHYGRGLDRKIGETAEGSRGK